MALVLAVLAAGLRLWAVRRSEAARVGLAESSLLDRYVRRPVRAIPFIRAGLLVAGIAAMVLVSGSGGAEVRRLDNTGREVILLLDASNSMLAQDMEPSRLQLQRDMAVRLATRLEARVGVVYFAGRGYVLSPLTTDARAIAMLAEGVRPASVGLGGSSLASGLTQAIDLLAGGEDDAQKAIVVFSDGEETSGAPFGDAVGRARSAGIVVHAVGIGTEAGGQIPLTREASLGPAATARRRDFPAVLTDSDGNTVITRLNEAPLRQMAGETGGRYVRASQGMAPIERQLALGSPNAAGATDDVVVAALLLLAFVSLWGDGFALPRG